MTSVEETTDGNTADSGPSGYAAARLRLLQEESRSGPSRRSALAALTDDWLKALFATAVQETGVRGAALVAVGGYGRAELSPAATSTWSCSTTAKPHPAPSAHWPTGSGTPSGTWDSPSTTPSAHQAKPARPPPKTSRCTSDCSTPGPSPHDVGLLAGLRTSVLADWRNHAAKRLPELHSLCRERAERAGELRFLLEPDLKEARGGLRDATVLRAVAASWLADAPREGLADARRRLLDARDALHLVTGRATDRLSLQEQTAVAAQLGLLDADALLREVYEAARVVSYAA